MTRFLAAALCLPFFACATMGRPAGSPAETQIAVTDPDGTAVVGEIRVQGLQGSPPIRDACGQSGSSCGVSVPAGVYLLKFYKMRGGRVGSVQRSGPSAKDRASGCLLSRVTITPGQPIACKSNGGWDRCKGTRVHTMNCGAAVANSWNPAPGEPRDLTDPDDDEELPANPNSSGTVIAPQPGAPVASPIPGGPAAGIPPPPVNGSSGSAPGSTPSAPGVPAPHATPGAPATGVPPPPTSGPNSTTAPSDGGTPAAPPGAPSPHGN